MPTSCRIQCIKTMDANQTLKALTSVSAKWKKCKNLHNIAYNSHTLDSVLLCKYSDLLQ